MLLNKYPKFIPNLSQISTLAINSANREYRKINEIGKVVSVKELNFMVGKGILRRIGKGRALRYKLNDYILALALCNLSFCYVWLR